MINDQIATYMRLRNNPVYVTGLRDLIACLPANLVMAEIGVFGGESTRMFLGSGKVKRHFAIDPWRQYDWPCPFDWQDVYDTFMAYAKDKPEIAVLRMPSLEAAAYIADASLDFVYIDGDHSYRAARADIETWRPKVRAGGFLGGHDLSEAFPGVGQALLDTRIGFGTQFRDTSWLVRV